ncbi:HEXXH motif domain-containing protein [Micromonospora endolithica]|uniref:HEXXH motif domain-containing protein n=1 Tax=Micromonospora endolithica TaxID=230091 RepID=A0A3A9ZH25_9ACTN|nr:HEXXH motif domain-containing protein [Micromonospora endolithica]RKN47529.1 HEXXH motif domain-containing protein [Micromonospora endolithica]TWJ21169.1 HEXXH motif-containing protein [Micromonospora endolithica]
MSSRTTAAHIVEADHFRQLAAGIDDHEAVRALWRSERSWRLVVLRRLLDAFAARDDATGPLPSLDKAWDLLSEADRTDHAATEEILARPTVGLWAAHTLRRVTRGDTASPPLWVDVGYLHSSAAAAAIRAGLDFTITVAVTHGTVVLPTVGAATLPGTTETAVVRSVSGQVTITGGATSVRVGSSEPGWHPPVLAEVTADGVRLAIELLDRDPYRDLRRPSAPLPLTARQIERWRADLAQAWEILVAEQRGRALSIAAGLRTVAPVPAKEQHRPLSASGAEAFGGVLLSEPDDPAQLAMSLVHETQHHKLGALLHLLDLVEEDRSRRFYAPWRDDPRPLGGLLQGAYAFCGIIDFWRMHRLRATGGAAALAHFEFALWRQQTLAVVRTLARSGQLTPCGEEFLARLHEQLAATQDDPVPEPEQTAAQRMAADHRAMWRAHNVRLAVDSDLALTAAWQSGERPPATVLDACGPELTVVAEPEIGWLDTRAVLTRHRLAPMVTPPARVRGATEADHALIAGNLDAARAGYLADLVREPASAHAWIGYALAADGPERDLLLRQPELVMAVARRHRQRPFDPERLLAWLTAGMPETMLREPEPRGWRVA